MFSALREVGGRIEAGERLEVADEMSLVVISAGQRHRWPFDPPSTTPAMNQLYRLQSDCH